MANIGGIVRDADGAPAADAWVAVTSLGRITASGADGRFRLARVPKGSHEVRVRGRDGSQATVEVQVPAQTLNVVLGAPAKAGGRRG
jgi:hypothetical protein